jgi:hypothetical protein
MVGAFLAIACAIYGLDRFQPQPQAGRYWFRIPIVGTAGATACLGAAGLPYLL